MLPITDYSFILFRIFLRLNDWYSFITFCIYWLGCWELAVWAAETCPTIHSGKLSHIQQEQTVHKTKLLTKKQIQKKKKIGKRPEKTYEGEGETESQEWKKSYSKLAYRHYFQLIKKSCIAAILTDVRTQHKYVMLFIEEFRS